MTITVIAFLLAPKLSYGGLAKIYIFAIHSIVR